MCNSNKNHTPAIHIAPNHHDNFPPDFKIAFQPIANLKTGEAYAFEALVRGINGESALTVLSKIPKQKKYLFDQICRFKAMSLALELGILSIPNCRLSLNTLPNSIYKSESCITNTLDLASKLSFPLERIIFEISETEKIEDFIYFTKTFKSPKTRQFSIAIDDFGAGYSGLNTMNKIKPNILKIDIYLIQNIDKDPEKQAIVQSIVLLGSTLNLEIIAEGIETISERNTLLKLGITIMQGYLFSQPKIGSLPKLTSHAKTNNNRSQD